MKLIENQWDNDREQICENIPEFKKAAELFASKPIGDINPEEFPVNTTTKASTAQLASNFDSQKPQAPATVTAAKD